MRLLAIDPGARSGFAVLNAGVVIFASCGSPEEHFGPWCPDVVVIENPVIYPHSKARPADILKLARIVGRYEERYREAEIHLVEPRQWKGTVSGDIMTMRIAAALTPDERIIANKSKMDHNMLDAIGLGKWALRQPWMRGR